MSIVLLIWTTSTQAILPSSALWMLLPGIIHLTNRSVSSPLSANHLTNQIQNTKHHTNPSTALPQVKSIPSSQNIMQTILLCSLALVSSLHARIQDFFRTLFLNLFICLLYCPPSVIPKSHLSGKPIPSLPNIWTLS